MKLDLNTWGPALSIVATVLVSLIINNSRFSGLNTRITEQSTQSNAGFTDLSARIAELSSKVDTRINDMAATLRAEMAKNQSGVLHKFADLETRVTKIDEVLRHLR